jgi:hypothetical protein
VVFNYKKRVFDETVDVYEFIKYYIGIISYQQTTEGQVRSIMFLSMGCSPLRGSSGDKTWCLVVFSYDCGYDK